MQLSKGKKMSVRPFFCVCIIKKHFIEDTSWIYKHKHWAKQVIQNPSKTERNHHCIEQHTKSARLEMTEKLMSPLLPSPWKLKTWTRLCFSHMSGTQTGEIKTNMLTKKKESHHCSSSCHPYFSYTTCISSCNVYVLYVCVTVSIDPLSSWSHYNPPPIRSTFLIFLHGWQKRHERRMERHREETGILDVDEYRDESRSCEVSWEGRAENKTDACMLCCIKYNSVVLHWQTFS